MILYHGSNQDIKEIDLTKTRPNKDFGQGFYLTADKEQAMQMAKQKVVQSGGTADDKVGVQLFRYMKKYIDLPTLVKNLQFVRLTTQYYFGTERAIKLLKKL